MFTEQLSVLQGQVEQLLTADGEMQTQLKAAQEGQSNAQVALFAYPCS